LVIGNHQLPFHVFLKKCAESSSDRSASRAASVIMSFLPALMGTAIMASMDSESEEGVGMASDTGEIFMCFIKPFYQFTLIAMHR
jgi:hypothetical protein